ncbi:hypothetical protein L0B52_04885 [Suttonella sp. R2A3]|uniref:hypothetical protein n=1 Tax=Suttonella sp. R2A3 TaxID=2908648 RepID=UPI001F2D1DE9|nr:hypothetical protein [Suttonella sp. R2A3]UJF23696.1 hypothetical protein L0B52_04885 [Suttonella sp. R2A3]
MIWELIATLIAGVGGAGIVIGLRFLFKGLSKAFIPAAAGIGMLTFQIYSEYTWFSHTQSLLPEESKVVAKVAQPSWYKPWSTWRPPVLKFVTLDTTSQTPVTDHPNLVQARLYFFERRMSAHSLSIIFDCQSERQANTPPEGTSLESLNWYDNAYSKRVAELLCSNQT